jgi:hypothetical protein
MEVDCAACYPVTLLPPAALRKLGLSPRLRFSTWRCGFDPRKPPF